MTHVVTTPNHGDSIMETGTVIHGTMRPEDLIPAFIAKADDILSGAWTLGDDVERRMEDTPDYFASEYAAWDLADLFDLLDDLAPEGFYFGAHPGNGSDYGFWPVDDEG